jgi:hypothetical protein
MDEKAITGQGGCSAARDCVGLDVTLYTADTTAPTPRVTAGVYQFTYPGIVDPAGGNEFGTAGGTPFAGQTFVNCNFDMATPNTGCADDFTASGRSTVAPGLTASAEDYTTISLTDLPFPGDYGFQDLDVLAQPLSEPNAFVILGIATVGLLAARKWCLT